MKIIIHFKYYLTQYFSTIMKTYFNTFGTK